MPANFESSVDMLEVAFNHKTSVHIDVAERKTRKMDTDNHFDKDEASQVDRQQWNTIHSSQLVEPYMCWLQDASRMPAG